MIDPKLSEQLLGAEDRARSLATELIHCVNEIAISLNLRVQVDGKRYVVTVKPALAIK